MKQFDELPLLLPRAKVLLSFGLDRDVLEALVAEGKVRFFRKKRKRWFYKEDLRTVLAGRALGVPVDRQ